MNSYTMNVAIWECYSSFLYNQEPSLCILLLYLTENRESRVSLWLKEPKPPRKTEDAFFLFFTSGWQQLGVTSESYIRQGPWPGLYVLCVNKFGSHTAYYTSRQHTSGTRHISAPYYDTLWYSMVFFHITFKSFFMRRKGCVTSKLCHEKIFIIFIGL